MEGNIQMKKAILITTFSIFVIGAATSSFAAGYCSPTVQQTRCLNSTQTFRGLNCATSSHFCWGGYDVTSCETCNSGYKLSSNTLSSTQCTNSYSYNTCLRDTGGEGDGCGTACRSCPPIRGIWTNVSGYTGYQQKQTAKCDESTNCECVRGYEYRCSAGYYGFRPECTTIVNVGTSCSGCSKCPDVPGKVDWVDESYSITSAAGSTIVNQCYIDGTASDHYIADQTGHYTIVGGKCYYKISL